MTTAVTAPGMIDLLKGGTTTLVDMWHHGLVQPARSIAGYFWRRRRCSEGRGQCCHF